MQLTSQPAATEHGATPSSCQQAVQAHTALYITNIHHLHNSWVLHCINKLQQHHSVAVGQTLTWPAVDLRTAHGTHNPFHSCMPHAKHTNKSISSTHIICSHPQGISNQLPVTLGTGSSQLPHNSTQTPQMLPATGAVVTISCPPHHGTHLSM